MAGMRKWPRSMGEQFVLAFVAAFLSSIAAFFYVFINRIILYSHTNPHDGQAGLGAFVEALGTSAITLFLVLLGAHIVQWIVVFAQWYRESNRAIAK
jgi:hypothetical protein